MSVSELPLRPLHTTNGSRQGGGPESPEALAISALLGSGQFVPEQYRVHPEDLSCWTALFEFCREYQRRSGQAPPLELVQRKYPDFVYIAGVDPSWATDQLRLEAGGRELRRKMLTGINLLNEEDVDAAYDVFTNLERPRQTTRPGISVFDPSLAVIEEDMDRIAVPYPSLQRVTGGIGSGELWYIASRTGEGKTYTLCNFAATAANEGARLVYYSLEMRAQRISGRIHRILAARDPDLFRRIHSPDLEVRQHAFGELRERVPGSIEVIDPSHGKATVDMVAGSLADADIVFVDHVGLMQNGSNRAVEDWRVMGLISNRFKEEALASGTALVAASQVNREGANSGGRPPKIDKLSQSDFLGQDGDNVVTFAKMSKHVRAFSAEKVREGEQAQFWTRYEPSIGRFDEISKEEALTRQAADEADGD